MRRVGRAVSAVCPVGARGEGDRKSPSLALSTTTLRSRARRENAGPAGSPRIAPAHRRSPSRAAGLEREHQREPSWLQLADHPGFSIRDIREIRQRNHRPRPSPAADTSVDGQRQREHRVSYGEGGLTCAMIAFISSQQQDADDEADVELEAVGQDVGDAEAEILPADLGARRSGRRRRQANRADTGAGSGAPPTTTLRPAPAPSPTRALSA